MVMNSRLVFVSFFAASVFVAAQACSRGQLPSTEGDTLSKKGDDVLVSCKQRDDGKGKAVAQSKLTISVVESDQAGSNQVALGFRGRWDDEKRISYSQGDQPVFATLATEGHKETLKSFKKECRGRCENYMIIVTGGGDEGTQFVALESLTLDHKKGTVKVVGMNESFVAEKSSFEADFRKCEINKNVLARIRRTLEE